MQIVNMKNKLLIIEINCYVSFGCSQETNLLDVPESDGVPGKNCYIIISSTSIVS